jgi:hypothetical protein
MKYSFLILILFFTAELLQATEKLWVPLGQPEGQMMEAVLATPDAQGKTVLVGNSTPVPTETVVPKVKDGHWVYKYPNGHPESAGDYSADKKEGVWKYYRPDDTECREIEFKDGVMTGNAVLWAADGNQKYFNHLTDVIQKVVPSDFKVKTFLPYWVDLLGDGNHQVLVIARSDTSSLVLVLDQDGNLLDSKIFTGFADDFVFGEIKKGGPICFGYDVGCDAQLGVCQWEFDLWDGSKIKSVLQYQGWYGNNNPFVMPVFQAIQGQTGIVTDNGSFQWDEASQTFKKVSNDSVTPEAGLPVSVTPTVP